MGKIEADRADFATFNAARLQRVRTLHRQGHIELEFFFGWDSIARISALYELGLVEHRTSIDTSDYYSMAVTNEGDRYLYHDTGHDIISIRPGKGRHVQKVCMEMLELTGHRSWMDRFYTDYLPSHIRHLIANPDRSWATRNAYESDLLREEGFMILGDVMKVNGLSTMHFELAGLLMPHPINVWFDSEQSIPTEFGELFLGVYGDTGVIALLPEQVGPLLKCIQRDPKLAADPPTDPRAFRMTTIRAEPYDTPVTTQRNGATATNSMRKEEAGDPVPICLEALRTGKNPRGALRAAREALDRWWAMDCTDREYSHEELMDMLGLRAFVLASVATVCVWNKEFAIADRIQPEFIYNERLWEHEQRREAIELYLIHLLFQEQFERVEAIFTEAAFKKEFLCYHDLYKSVMDPHYEFQSKQGPFLAVVNKVNQYCRQIGRKHLL